MTPQEKADSLFRKMYEVRTVAASDISKYFAKQCALIAVDEIMKQLSSLELHPLGTYTNPKIDYWIEVKEEIENL